MEEKKEHINDTKIFKGYVLFMKFLNRPEELTDMDKRNLKEMGVIV